MERDKVKEIKEKGQSFIRLSLLGIQMIKFIFQKR